LSILTIQIFFDLNKNLHTLLSGPLYIDSMYAASCVPAVFKSLTDVNSVSLTTAELMVNAQISHENPKIQSNANKVVIVDFNQPVVKYDYSGWLGTQSYMAILKQLAADESVAGVVLKIDSGGGQVYGTGEMYDFIKNYSKPIVAFTHGYMCSGAYYIAAPTNKIIANKRADAIGSIGAYATIVDTNGIYEHFGAKVHSIYATKSTAKNSDYNEVVENSNYTPYITNTLDPIVETFIADMKAARPQLKEEVFNGGTWNGEQSVAMGLVDQTGTIEDAINAIFDLSLQNSTNIKITNMNTKQLPSVQSVLGLDAPLAYTEEKGTYLNSEQLDALENSISSLTATNVSITEELATAKANTELNEQLTASAGVVASMEVSIDAMLTAAGLEIAGTIAEKTTALSAKVSEMGLKDASAHTSLKIDADSTFVDSKMVGGVDVSGALNN